MTVTVYHNTRCSKSRGALQLLEERNIPHEVRLYLQQPLTRAELQALLAKLRLPPSALLRKGEDIYKTLNADAPTEDQWLDHLVQHPQLMERPVVVVDDRAVIARPPERVLELLEGSGHPQTNSHNL